MADSSVKSSKKNKKRKLTSPESGDKLKNPPKTQRIGSSETQKEPIEVEAEEGEGGGGPWRNLKLILSIQNREINIKKKVDLAFNFVNSRVKGVNDGDEDNEIIKTSRLIVFLNDWIQSLLISSDKKSEDLQACLDFRCWRIFKFCLDESLKLTISLSFSRNLLRAIACVARNALSLLNDLPDHIRESLFIGEQFELYRVVVDSVSLVFLSDGSLLNENLDLWISAIDPVLQLVHKICAENLAGSNAGALVLQLSCLVLEPFAKFLKVHPTKKNGFRDFVDKLLEPLLHLLGVLNLQISGSNTGLVKKLLKLVEEVLSQGLFHPAHIDGFLAIHSTEKHIASHDGESRDSKTVIKSYHRHLFDKLERIVAAKKIPVMIGMGELFHLLVDCVKKQRSSLQSEGAGVSQHAGDNSSGHISNLSKSDSALEEKSFGSSNWNAQVRKSLFDFFVQIMEPLLLEMNRYLQANFEMGPALFDAHCLMKSINKLLACLMHEKVYLRTEDPSEGAFCNFLKKVYNIIISFSLNLLEWSKWDMGEGKQNDVFPLLAEEIIIVVGYFLDIEYQVFGNDLVSLWLMIISYLVIGPSFINEPEPCPLTSQILNLGCQLVKLYSELRQVKNIIFALCKAIKATICSNPDPNYASYLSCTTSLPYEAYGRSVGMLLSSPDCRLSIHNAIKAIPEGQASACIEQLSMDLSETVKWMKIGCSVTDGKEFGKLNMRNHKQNFDVQAELLGKCLSEIYTLVLDSLTVTVGNSNLLALSLKDLMTAVRTCMSSLVGQQPLSVNEFLLSVTGRTLEKSELSYHWVFVFFFRLYMSCRSLCRQAISLMPPRTSKEMSTMMGDSFTAYSGRDWMESADWTDDGYFSWIARGSTSLVQVIQSIFNYFQDSLTNCCPLIYVLNTLALQRLVDLNRQIKSLEYLLQNNDYLVQCKLLDDAGLSIHCKRNKKCERHISYLKKEAMGLTEFMLGYLSLVDGDQMATSTSDDATDADVCNQGLHESGMWNLGLCALNEKSLPTAIWWIISQSVDIWSVHSAKKKLKMFLSVLIRTSLPSLTTGSVDASEAGQLDKVTVHQISSALLRDSILYEHKFVRRHFATRFCHILEKFASPIFSGFSIGPVDFSLSPDWPEVLKSLENSSTFVSGSKLARDNDFPKKTLISGSSNKLPTNICNEQKSYSFTACQSLLHLLSRMPKGYFDSKSVSVYATYILNFERLLVGSLLECQGVLRSHECKLLRLFVSCRRTLKCIMTASCQDKKGACQSSIGPTFLENSYLVQWLFKSVSMVVGLQEADSEGYVHEVRDMIFSLMDQTLYVFFMLNKNRFTYAVQSEPISEKTDKEQSSCVLHQQMDSEKTDHCSGDSLNNAKLWKSVDLLAENLKEQAESLLIPLKDVISNEGRGVDVSPKNLNKVSSVISCFGGFLWSLASAMNQSDHKGNMLMWKHEAFFDVKRCIILFADFISFFLHILVKDDKQPRTFGDVESFPKLDVRCDSFGSDGFPLRDSAANVVSCHKRNQQSAVPTTCSAPATIEGESDNATIHGYGSRFGDSNHVAHVLNKVDSYDHQNLNIHILRSLLKGDHPEVAFALRELVIAYSAILRLNLQINNSSLTSLVPLITSISEVLLLELVEADEMLQSFVFVWLDGVLKYLEELGGYFPLANPTLTRDLYARLIGLHIRALGKCISLQGKKATLASHETESSTKLFEGHMGSCGTSPSCGPYGLDEFKSRLRMSFKVLIQKSSELHLVSTIQAIERALVGVLESCTTVHQINMGSVDGGKVSSVVAAGVDCLDLVLEYVSGRKRLNVVKRHIQSLIGGLFNIILHLQSPLIFYERTTCREADNSPDPGSLILMCVEVLTRIGGKHALFQMDSWHVGQCLRIPEALFQDFHQLKLSEAPHPYNSLLYLDNQDNTPVASTNFAVDRQFAIELFASCCRLLYTVLKHHKSECEQCVALLQGSAHVLLHCLETVPTDLVTMKGSFAWHIQEAVKCACLLRRIYEELRQQKDVFGRHCFKFLASYIWVYSGYGPLKTGIRREIDDALKPGVYALIDACSPNDLQYLHTTFGAGPCRSTLASLQHDYKQNFKYEGKV